MLHEPKPTHSGRGLGRAGSGPARPAAAGRWRRAARRPRPPRRRPPRPRAATSTLRKPWWVKPVSGSVCRIAWCSPAVSLNGSSRSRQAQITAASSTGRREQLGGEPAGAELRPRSRAPSRARLGDPVQRGEQAPGQRDLGVPVQVGAVGAAARAVRSGRAAGPRRAWRPAASTWRDDARRGSSRPAAAQPVDRHVADDADLEPLVPAEQRRSASTSGDAGTSSGADQVGVPGGPVFAVGGDGVGAATRCPAGRRPRRRPGRRRARGTVR